MLIQDLLEQEKREQLQQQPGAVLNQGAQQHLQEGIQRYFITNLLLKSFIKNHETIIIKMKNRDDFYVKVILSHFIFSKSTVYQDYQFLFL